MPRHTRSGQREARRALRSHGTPAEARLWLALKCRKLQGRRFRRQAGFGPFIADFYCPEERLVVELDGAPHFTPFGQAYDAARTAYLVALGVRVVRFENRLVWEDLPGVLSAIAAHFAER